MSRTLLGVLRPRYVFIVWHSARSRQDRILADLAERFHVLAEVEVTWTPGVVFARSLTRMYGEALPPGSDKEQECGTGPFLLVVIEDKWPRMRLRRQRRRPMLHNTGVLAARSRYRTWAGGGNAVHASDSVVETERNLLLLLGLKATAAEQAPSAAGDPVGTNGWASIEELERTLEPYGGRLSASDPLTVLARDAWWSERIVGGLECGPGEREVQLADRPVRVRVLSR